MVIFFVRLLFPFFLLWSNQSIEGVIVGEKPRKGIRFEEGSWKEVLAKAEAQNKIIFVDFYATWCGPCKKLKKYTFTDPKVSTYFNENFVNVAIDAEKGEGITLSGKYLIEAYPTLLFLYPNGQVAESYTGFFTPEELFEVAEKLKK